LKTFVNITSVLAFVSTMFQKYSSQAQFILTHGMEKDLRAKGCIPGIYFGIFQKQFNNIPLFIFSRHTNALVGWKRRIRKLHQDLYLVRLTHLTSRQKSFLNSASFDPRMACDNATRLIVHQLQRFIHQIVLFMPVEFDTVKNLLKHFASSHIGKSIGKIVLL
jgi:hypothetical protein